MISKLASMLGLLAVVPAFVSAATINVEVGAGGALAYSPSNIPANPGDEVIFNFNPKNHTVTQTSFAQPCVAKDGGINSGFMPVANASVTKTFSVTVNDTQPVWFFCAQGGFGTATSHCGQGMVFAINCGLDGAPNSFANFSASAKATVSNSTTPSPSGSTTLIPAASPSLVTDTVSFGSSVWTSTYSSYPGSPDPTPNAVEQRVHKVVVGGTGLTFAPASLVAKPLDIIQFEFHEKNHTATQSSFANPCVRNNANSAQAIDSGFMPVSAGSTSFPTFNVTVNSTAPIWFYCRQSTHCASGMVFAVNSDESGSAGANSFAAFQARAKSSSTTGSNSTSPTNSTGTGSTGNATPVDFALSTLLLPLVLLFGLIL